MGTPYSSFLPYVANIGGALGQIGQQYQQQQIEAQQRQQEQQMQALKMLEEQIKIKQLQAPGAPMNIPGVGWVQVDPMTGQLKPVQGAQGQAAQKPQIEEKILPSGEIAEMVQDPVTGTWKTEFRSPPKPAASEEADLEAEAQRLKSTGELKTLADIFKWKQQQRLGFSEEKALVSAKARSQASAQNIDPETLAFQAHQIRLGVPIQNFVSGFGDNANAYRRMLWRAVMQQAKAEGDQVGSQAAAIALFQANKTALSWNQRQTAAISSFEKSVQKQFELIKKQARLVPRTGSPLINQYEQWLVTRVGGDPNTQGLFNLISTTTAEYAKVMTGNIGASASTDSARGEARKLLDAAFSPGQLQTSMDLMRQEMGNRLSGLKEESSAILTEMSAPKGKGPSIPKIPEKVPRGTLETAPMPGARKAPDGKWYVPDPARPGKYLMVVQ